MRRGGLDTTRHQRWVRVGPGHQVTGMLLQTPLRMDRFEALLTDIQILQTKLQSEITELRGKFDAWDVTVQRMQDYQRQQAMSR